MHFLTHVHTCIHTNLCTYTQMRVRVLRTQTHNQTTQQVRAYVPLCICYTYVHTCICSFMPLPTHTCVHKNVCVSYIHTHIYANNTIPGTCQFENNHIKPLPSRHQHVRQTPAKIFLSCFGANRNRTARG